MGNGALDSRTIAIEGGDVVSTLKANTLAVDTFPPTATRPDRAGRRTSSQTVTWGPRVHAAPSQKLPKSSGSGPWVPSGRAGGQSSGSVVSCHLGRQTEFGQTLGNGPRLTRHGEGNGRRGGQGMEFGQGS
ncbi:unnamed protein product [Calypogeia fissa]